MQGGEAAGFSRSSVRKRKCDHFVASRNRRLEYNGKRVAEQERPHSDPKDMNYEGTTAKASPCPERRIRTPLPQQSSSSTRKEESQWSAQERREQYVNNSECKQLDIDEVEECSLGPEYADIDVKAEKGELLVASKWCWEDCQKQTKRKRNKVGRQGEKLK